MDPTQPEAPVLLTGMGGVLGAGLARGGAVEQWPGVVVAGREAPEAWRAAPFVCCDLSQPGAARRLVDALQPRAVLHAAAVSRIDACERQPELAHRMHVQVVEEFLAACPGRVIFLSTDQVFDGQAKELAEDAEPAPIHAYGRSKAEGERACLAGGGVVVRLPLLLGPAVPGRPARMGADAVLVEAARKAQPWDLFEDEWRAPADAADLCAPLGKLLERLAAADPAMRPPEPIYHLAGADAIDRYHLGQAACAAAGVEFVHRRARLAAWQGDPRPPRLILRCELAIRDLGFEPPDLRQSLARSAAAASQGRRGQET
ncbi:MAG: hypothetical protein CMJ94_10320 [Planctomycetes bacterium]|nr:hypothetical protein [Planctomycetota bacterium]